MKWSFDFIRNFFYRKDEQLDKYFEELDLDKVVPKLLQYFFNKYSCENIYWILHDELPKLLEENKDYEKHTDHYVKRGAAFQSIKLQSTEQILSIMKKISRDESYVKLLTPGDSREIVIPVRHFLTHKVMAYIILIEPKKLK